MTQRARPLDWIASALAELERDDHRRHLQTRAGSQGAVIELDGARLLNFGSNDYLGLAGDDRLRQAAARALADEGVGAGALHSCRNELVSRRSRQRRHASRQAAFDR